MNEGDMLNIKSSDFLIISSIVLIYNIDIVHARSRAPAWSCWLATKFTRSKFVTTLISVKGQ